MDEEVLAAFAEKGLLPSKEVAHWRAPAPGEVVSQPWADEIISFLAFTSAESGIPRTGSYVGSSMSGAWSCSTSIRLGCCISPASSPCARASLGWNRTWTSFGGCSPGELCPWGIHLRPRRWGASLCRKNRAWGARIPRTSPVTPTGDGMGSGSTLGIRWVAVSGVYWREAGEAEELVVGLRPHREAQGGGHRGGAPEAHKGRPRRGAGVPHPLPPLGHAVGGEDAPNVEIRWPIGPRPRVAGGATG